MRSILVQVGHDAGMSARLATAMDLARTHDGHVTLLIDTPMDRFVTVDPYGGTFVAREALDAALAEDDAMAAAFAARLERDDVPFDVVKFETRPLDALAAAARLADVVIVSRSCGFAGDLAIIARCPVLVLPDNTALAIPLQTACIAWDGSDEAALALRLAVPLLWGCGTVHVLTVLTGRPQSFPPTDAQRYLSRHGIKTNLIELERGTSVEESLAAKAHALGAQLLVMGAYGHGRIREFLLGGVSRYFLDDCAAPPLFLAH